MSIFQKSGEQKYLKQLDAFPAKHQDWHTSSYKAEWEDYFIQESDKALELKAKIDATDQEIDRMVVQLYELTEEEVEMVEKGQKEIMNMHSTTSFFIQIQNLLTFSE